MTDAEKNARPVVSLAHARKSFGDVEVLHDISLSVTPGEGEPFSAEDLVTLVVARAYTVPDVLGKSLECPVRLAGVRRSLEDDGMLERVLAGANAYGNGIANPLLLGLYLARILCLLRLRLGASVCRLLVRIGFHQCIEIGDAIEIDIVLVRTELIPIVCFDTVLVDETLSHAC